MSGAIQVMSPAERQQDLLVKSSVFKEYAALVQSGFFPAGVDTVPKALAICWIGDALGVHHAVAIQHITPVKGRLYASWRLKWGLVCSRYPEAEFEIITQDEERCVVQGRKQPSRPWVKVEVTKVAIMKNPVTSRNELYASDWPDMSFKACMHRLCDRMAPEAMLGLPSGEMVPESDIEAPAERPGERAASAAEVLESAAKVGPVVAGRGSGERVDATPEQRDTPAEAPAPPAVRDFVTECFTKIDAVWGLKPKARTTPAARREKCEMVLSALRGAPIKLTTTLATSDAADILAYLNEKYPDGAVAAVEGGGEGTVSTDAPAADPAAKGFDEQHADANEVVEYVVEGEAEVPVEDDTPSAFVEAQDAAAKARYEADGNIVTIFAIANNARKTHPDVRLVKEAPAGSGSWYLVNMGIVQEMGRTSGILLQKDGQQKIDEGTCRTAVTLMRQRGFYEKS